MNAKHLLCEVCALAISSLFTGVSHELATRNLYTFYMKSRHLLYAAYTLESLSHGSVSRWSDGARLAGEQADFVRGSHLQGIRRIYCLVFSVQSFGNCSGLVLRVQGC